VAILTRLHSLVVFVWRAQENPIEEVGEIDVVPNVKAAHEVRVGISNSFGFGGHNSVVAFGPYKA
jgi:3-oxoacyl-[acyl-carrier-protein] synthase II